MSSSFLSVPLRYYEVDQKTGARDGKPPLFLILRYQRGEPTLSIAEGGRGGRRAVALLGWGARLWGSKRSRSWDKHACDDLVYQISSWTWPTAIHPASRISFSKQLQILNTVERNRSAKLGGNNKLGNSQRRIFSVSISLFGLGGELPKQYALTDSYLLYFCDYVDSATPVLYLEERATRRPVFQFRLSDIKSFALPPWSDPQLFVLKTFDRNVFAPYFFGWNLDLGLGLRASEASGRYFPVELAEISERIKRFPAIEFVELSAGAQWYQISLLEGSRAAIVERIRRETEKAAKAAKELLTLANAAVADGTSAPNQFDPHQTFSSAWTTARSGYEDDKEEIFERPRKIRRVKEELS